MNPYVKSLLAYLKKKNAKLAGWLLVAAKNDVAAFLRDVMAENEPVLMTIFGSAKQFSGSELALYELEKTPRRTLKKFERSLFKILLETLALESPNYLIIDNIFTFVITNKAGLNPRQIDTLLRTEIPAINMVVRRKAFIALCNIDRNKKLYGYYRFERNLAKRYYEQLRDKSTRKNLLPVYLFLLQSLNLGYEAINYFLNEDSLIKREDILEQNEAFSKQLEIILVRNGFDPYISELFFEILPLKGDSFKVAFLKGLIRKRERLQKYKKRLKPVTTKIYLEQLLELDSDVILGDFSNRLQHRALDILRKINGTGDFEAAIEKEKKRFRFNERNMAAFLDVFIIFIKKFYFIRERDRTEGFPYVIKKEDPPPIYKVISDLILAFKQINNPFLSKYLESKGIAFESTNGRLKVWNLERPRNAHNHIAFWAVYQNETEVRKSLQPLTNARPQVDATLKQMVKEIKPQLMEID